jgi:hypothetical protein
MYNHLAPAERFAFAIVAASAIAIGLLSRS